MRSRKQHRRAFLRSSFGIAAGGVLGAYARSSAGAESNGPSSKNDRPRVGAIGVGWTPERTGRGTTIARHAKAFGDIVAVCDVDRTAVEHARETLTAGKAKIYENYRDVLERDDIDAVLIGTPDHWHSKIAIEAMKAGKDIYCEKPLTLTIDEGKRICRVARETRRVFQVGTQQRSEYRGKFLTAVAMVRDGRIGKVRRVFANIGAGPAGGPFPVTKPPAGLNWEAWLGQAPLVGYSKERCHRLFRWWYEYSGGKMTDWGAHHVDIAQWAIGMENSGPTSIEGTGTIPNVKNGYNTATVFRVTCRYENGVELVIRHDGENGIEFEGEDGKFFVGRSKLIGKPVDALETNPLPPDAITSLYNGMKPGNHMGNFFACLRTRRTPISDVFTHHRSITTCHLANICLRLGRKLTWDPIRERIVGDDEADAWQKREQRQGYEISV